MAARQLSNRSQTLAFSTVGAVILWQRAKQPIGLILLISGVWPACAFLLIQYAQLSVPAPSGAVWSALAADIVFNVGVATWLLLVLLFPDGRLPSQRWWAVLWVLGFSIVTSVALAVTAPGPLASAPRLLNPWGGLGGAAIRPVLGQFSVWSFAAVAVVAFGSPIVRFHRSRGRERQQIKILVNALVGALALTPLPLLIREDELPYLLTNAFWVFGIAGEPMPTRRASRVRMAALTRRR